MSVKQIVCIAFSIWSATGICSAQSPIADFSATNLRVNESVGYSVATDGRLVLIGTGAGSAFLFDPFSNQQLAKFTVPDPRFNTSVALEGTTAVIGTRVGAVVYDFSDLSNIVETHLVPDDGLHALFGISVDLSGDTVIVGANGDDYAGQFTGSAYLFDRTTGNQFAKLAANDGKAFDNFGIGVAVDGDRAVVGSVRATNSQGNSHGAVYLYDASPNASGNRQLDKFTAPPVDVAVLPSFGYQVDISGDSVLALAPSGTSFRGESYIWQTDGTPSAIPGSLQGRYAGDPLSISGEFSMVGFDASNQARIYDLNGTEAGRILSPEIGSTGFGFSVALAGDLVVVGSPGSPNGGAAYIYSLRDILVPEPSSCAIFFTAITLVTVMWRKKLA